MEVKHNDFVVTFLLPISKKQEKFLLTVITIINVLSGLKR